MKELIRGREQIETERTTVKERVEGIEAVTIQKRENMRIIEENIRRISVKIDEKKVKIH